MKVLGMPAAVVVIVIQSSACSAPSPPLGEDPGVIRESGSASPDGAAGQTVVKYSGIEVKVPTSWERLETSGCEFGFDRWGPPESDPCDYVEGVAFYGSALFDPANGPGVRRTTENGTPGWGGYVLRGDWAVYAFYDDRSVVRDVLDSAIKVDGAAETENKQ